MQFAEIIVHENYDPNKRAQSNDIALIRLPRMVEFTDYVSPICLPFAPQLKIIDYDDMIFTIAGFGRIENGKIHSL